MGGGRWWEPSPADDWHEAALRIQSSYEADASPWTASLRVAVAWLSKMPKLSDRISVLDRLGRFVVGPLQYIDDTTMPCPSVGSLPAVIADKETSACEKIAASTGSRINRKAGKTTVMAMCGSPPPSPDAVGCEVTSTHTCLGFLLDDQLSMEPMLNAVLAHASTACSEFSNAASSAGVPLPVIAAEIPSRIVSVVKYRAPFLVLASNLELSLNHAQFRWALNLLGCDRSDRLKRALPLTQLGWTSRLGSVVLETAIATLARIECLQEDHPAAVMFRVTSQVTLPSWVTVVRQHMLRLRRFGWILPITEHAAFAPSVLMAKCDPAFRKQLVKQYREPVVAPVLRAYDDEWRREQLQSFQEGFSMSFEQLPVQVRDLSWALSLVDLGLHTQRYVRTWLLVRCSGRWPPSSESPTGPTFRDICPWCGGVLVSVLHALCECPATDRSRQALMSSRYGTGRSSPQDLLRFVFCMDSEVPILQTCIYYVNEILVNVPRQGAEVL